jgi:hypothetical protein
MIVDLITTIQRPYNSLRLLVWSTNYKKLSPWQGGHIYIMWRASGGFGKINQEIPITSHVSSNHDSFTILFQWKLHERNRRCPWSQQDVRFSLIICWSDKKSKGVVRSLNNGIALTTHSPWVRSPYKFALIIKKYFCFNVVLLIPSLQNQRHQLMKTKRSKIHNNPPINNCNDLIINFD